MKRKLIKLLQSAPADVMGNHGVGALADHLIANGVTLDNQVSSSKWIHVSERKPTKDDADKYGRVLVIEYGMITLVNYLGPINYPDRFPYWMPMPEPPKEES